ncbi:MAG: OmpH family outer membrane protein [Selenomonadaceae bacterium]|nr:OmpH family outer membrane protein [Selenomonadaceae bacterium]
MTESTQIKAVIEEGQKKVEEIEKEAQAEFEKNPNWTDEEKLKAQGDLQRKLMGINQSYATQLQHKIQEAMNDIAKKNDLDAIVDSSKENPIVLKGGIDLTDEVIKKLQ